MGPAPSLPHLDEAQLHLLRDDVQQRPQLATNNAEDLAHLRREKQAHQRLRAVDLQGHASVLRREVGRPDG